MEGLIRYPIFIASEIIFILCYKDNIYIMLYYAILCYKDLIKCQNRCVAISFLYNLLHILYKLRFRTKQ